MKELAILGQLIQPDYIVYKSGSTYYAQNQSGQTISNSAFATILSTLNTNLSSGGLVFFKAGTYDIGTATTISNSINLIGAGRGKTIFRRTVAGTGGTLTCTGSGITISGITFDGNYPTNTSNIFHELDISASTDALVTDVEIKKFTNIGLVAGNSATNQISDCVITGVNVTGKSPFGIWSDSASLNTRITNCIITDCALNAIFAGGKAVISECYFANNAIAGGGQVATGDNSTFLGVYNCIFEPGAVLDSAIEIGHQTLVGGEYVCIGNRITGQHHWGISSNAAPMINTTTIIANNIIENCSLAGIQITGAQQHFVITGNVCFGNQYGIGMDSASANHYVIANNICYSNTSAQIQDIGGPDKSVANNITA